MHLIRTVVKKVDTEAALISLEESKAFDRVDHKFLGAMLKAAVFGKSFHKWIRILYDSPRVTMVEVNGRRSNPSSLTLSIRQGCPFSPSLYVLALEPFLCKLKANLVLHGITLPGANKNGRYSAYTEDVTMFVADMSEVIEVGREIGRYEMVIGAKINRAKSVGLRLVGFAVGWVCGWLGFLKEG